MLCPETTRPTFKLRHLCHLGPQSSGIPCLCAGEPVECPTQDPGPPWGHENSLLFWRFIREAEVSRRLFGKVWSHERVLAFPPRLPHPRGQDRYTTESGSDAGCLTQRHLCLKLTEGEHVWLAGPSAQANASGQQSHCRSTVTGVTRFPPVIPHFFISPLPSLLFPPIS